MTFIYYLLIYLFFVWVLLPLVVPFLYSKNKLTLPESLPQPIAEIVSQIKFNNLSKEEALKIAYDFVTTNYKGSRIKTVTEFWKALINPLSIKSGFMHCTGQNYILRVILLKSELFDQGEIKTVLRPLNFFIHQNLQVRLDAKWINIDPWAKSIGVPYKGHAPFIG